LTHPVSPTHSSPPTTILIISPGLQSSSSFDALKEVAASFKKDFYERTEQAVDAGSMKFFV
jgi:hypothetical protein